MPVTVFDKPIFPGAKVVVAELTVTNTSGSYSNVVMDDRISASMKAYALEIDDPSIFGAKINVTSGAGQYTVSCSDVAGSTTIKISFLKILDDPTSVTSTEFDILENQISLLNSEIVASTIVGDTCPNRIAKNEYVFLKDSTIDGKADGLYKSGATINANTTVTAGMISERTVGYEMKKIYDDLGNISSLNTTVKTSAVAAINEVSDAIANINTKISPQNPGISPTYASHVTSTELIIRKSGGMVVGHLIFAFDSSYSGGGGMGEIITNVGGLPKSAVTMQMPIVCVAGTNAGKTGRVRISTDGKLQFWYSNVAGSASETYLIPICYPTND